METVHWSVGREYRCAAVLAWNAKCALVYPGMEHGRTGTVHQMVHRAVTKVRGDGTQTCEQERLDGA